MKQQTFKNNQDQAIGQIYRLSGVYIHKGSLDGDGSIILARRKLLRELNRQKMKSKINSTRYDSNLHLALHSALRALELIANKNRQST